MMGRFHVTAVRVRSHPQITNKTEADGIETVSKDMMTAFRNSLTWKDTVQHAVSIYSFLILGKEMSGEDFITEIKKRYDVNNPRTRALLHALENHLIRIKVRADGYTEYSTK